MKGNRFLFSVSWIALLLLCTVVVLYSALSLMRAYTSYNDALVPGFTLRDLREAGSKLGETGGDEVVNAFKGRRATAAVCAIGYALLAAIIILIPYRRAERWAWWALLAGLVLPQVLSLARAVALHTTFGLGAPGIVLAFSLLGLLAGAPMIFRVTSDR